MTRKPHKNALERITVRSRAYPGKARTLERLNRALGGPLIENAITKLMRNRADVKLLEIGCGVGRVLMELRRRFPEIELHGINRGRLPTMRRRDDFRLTSIYFDIFTRTEAASVALPHLHCLNAEHLNFKDESFDVVISQWAIPLIKRKDRVIEETWRILREGGVAFLHLDIRDEAYPDFLDFETPRFIVYGGGRHITLKKLLARKRAMGFDISCRTVIPRGIRKTFLFMHKNSRHHLSLDLELDEKSSFNLSNIDGMPDDDSRWGHRSVFNFI